MITRSAPPVSCQRDERFRATAAGAAAELTARNLRARAAGGMSAVKPPRAALTCGRRRRGERGCGVATTVRFARLKPVTRAAAPAASENLNLSCSARYLRGYV